MGTLAPALDWSMVSFGSTVAWEECASNDPTEWDYADLAIFYSAGRCHHLAIAHTRRDPLMRLAVLFETHEDELYEPGCCIPHHVFALSRDNHAHDVAGRRPIDVLIQDFDSRIGFMRPEIRVYACEEDFRLDLLERHDRPLSSVEEIELDRAARLLEVRGARLAREHRAHEAAEKARFHAMRGR